MLRTILALALASSAWAETICSLEPKICNGTYSPATYSGNTIVCAPLHRPPCTMHHPTRGVFTCLQGLGASGAGRGRRAALA